MIRQVVFSEEEYEDIERKLLDYSRIKKQLNELEKVREEFDDFKEQVKEIFLDKNGEIFHRETGKYYSNYLFLNKVSLAKTFNEFFGDRFLEESELKVDHYWKFEGL